MLMSNLCYLAVIMISLVALGGYCSLSKRYYWLILVTWWLILVTGGYRLFLLVPTFKAGANAPTSHPTSKILRVG